MAITPTPKLMRRLAGNYDATRLAAALAPLIASDWREVPLEPAGHHAVILVSVGGTSNADYAWVGPLQPTSWLRRCPAIKSILIALGVPLSRCRLLCLAAGSTVPPLADHSYHAFRRRVIYLPLITTPEVTLLYDKEVVHLPAGETWCYDLAKPHGFHNHSPYCAIHLVIETQHPDVHHDGIDNLQQLLEPYCFQVLTPDEITALTATMMHEAAAQFTLSEQHHLAEKMQAFIRAWTEIFAQYGHDATKELFYRDLILMFEDEIAKQLRSRLMDGPGGYALQVLCSMLQPRSEPPAKKRSTPAMPVMQHLRAARQHHMEPCRPPVFDRPIFIMSAPRSGSTLLFETMARFPDLWTTGSESHELIENIPELHPAAHAYTSNRLTAADATSQVSAALRAQFTRRLLDRDGRYYCDLPPTQQPERVRFLEKTPKNALRIPFFHAVFPDARFVVLYRRPEETLGSLLEGWRSQRFTAYQPLPGWPHRAWKFLLVPGWEQLIGRSMAEIVAHQWRMAYQTILDDLYALPADQWLLLRYADLVANPGDAIRQLADFAALHSDARVAALLQHGLPLSSMTFSTPDPDKWRTHAAALATVLPGLAELVNRLEQLA